jgi:elongation factor P
MQAKEIKNGAIVVVNGAPCLVRGVSVQTPSARGAATIYKYRGTNLITKQKADFSLRGGESLDEADFSRQPVKLMYTDGSEVHFLDQQDFNQYSLPLDELEDELGYLTEETEDVYALIYNEQCVGLQLPAAVTLKITLCEPNAKGNSATSRYKGATLETGLSIQVPPYIEQGETVKVDTRNGEFLGRL